MVQTHHPDLDLGDADYSIQSRPVRAAELSDRVAIGA
jgi:hypothetical protein